MMRRQVNFALADAVLACWLALIGLSPAQPPMEMPRPSYCASPAGQRYFKHFSYGHAPAAYG